MAAVSVIRSSLSRVVLFKNWAQLIMSFLPLVTIQGLTLIEYSLDDRWLS